MSDERVVRQCSPTLAGIKTGNLFPCNDVLLQADIRSINRKLVSRGLRMIPIPAPRNMLVYLYRPQRLARDLQDPVARQILEERGYQRGREAWMVMQLVRRFAQKGAFPHEVGLFLGYPPQDVDAFIHHHCAACAVGCWKAYGNVAQAKRQFAMCKKCTQIYCGLYEKGIPIEKLAVKEQGL